MNTKLSEKRLPVQKVDPFKLSLVLAFPLNMVSFFGFGFRLQISALVLEIFKFEKWVKYANEMADDVIHSTQYYLKYINGDILANLQHRSLKLGRLIVLYEKHLRL